MIINYNNILWHKLDIALKNYPDGMKIGKYNIEKESINTSD